MSTERHVPRRDHDVRDDRVRGLPGAVVAHEPGHAHCVPRFFHALRFRSAGVDAVLRWSAAAALPGRQALLSHTVCLIDNHGPRHLPR